MFVNEDNFVNVIDPYLMPLQSTSLRLTRNEEDARDLVQETMLKAYKSLHQYQVDTNFKAWIFRILVNTYITSYRKRVKQPLRVSYDDMEDFYMYQSLDDSQSAMARGKDSLIDHQFVDEITFAMENLPAQFRLAITLADVEGFTYKEIADIMDVPLGTIMSRLFRGRKILQKSLWAYARERGLVVGEYSDHQH